MTRTTFKALWVGGGGLIATWLAVSPTNSVPTTTRAHAVARPAAVSQQTAEDLNALATRLHERTAAVTLQPPTRNPFSFGLQKSVTPANAPRASLSQTATVEAPTSPAVVGPALTLSGIARTGAKRTAIISGAGQMYVVSAGDPVAGFFTVVSVEPEAVLLRDAAGGELRLGLPQ
jgi:hypothetical protein